MILLASKNKGKIKEIRKILNHDIKSLNDIEEIDIDENGSTFLENAIIKAKTCYFKTKIPSIAEDSGLEIDVLDGFPGILTNRFLGENKSDSDKNQAILEKMKDKTNRTCYFTCAFAYFDGNNLITSTKSLQGEIALKEVINQGFGFDSIFLYKENYLSNMSITEKNQISPRRLALEKLIIDIKKVVNK